MTQKTFVIHRPMHSLEGFAAFVRTVAGLQAHGRVLINIGDLADKSWYGIPAGGSPWHEYAAYNPALFKFFPHPRLAPYLPEDFVAANRRLMLDKVAILREHGIGASFWTHEPNLLPEDVFVAHPHLRGARVDHPRRSTKDAFAACVDHDETLEMTAWMYAQFKRTVPELEAISFKSNDAGSGLCWSENSYSGPNGPAHCRHRSIAERASGLLKAIHTGVTAGGGDVDVHMALFSTDAEIDALAQRLPPRTHLKGRSRSSVSLGSRLSSDYPVLGLLNPLGLITALERAADPAVRFIFLDFRASYDRGYENLETIEKVVAIVDGCLSATAPLPAQERLDLFCANWGGPARRQALTDAFVQLDNVFRQRSSDSTRISPLYTGVSLRHITRPLVIKPEALSADETAYFLPYIFNPSVAEGLSDYVDLHGGRMYDTPPPSTEDPRNAGITALCQSMLAVAETLDGLADAPQGPWLLRLATSLRIWSSIYRSSNNFRAAQIIRDRNREALACEHLPAKTASWSGHPDFIPWSEITRDEFDNTHALLRVLSQGGIDLIVHAKDSRHQDTFVLGPDLIQDLQRKAAIMRAHWTDVQKFLASPLK